MLEFRERLTAPSVVVSQGSALGSLPLWLLDSLPSVTALVHPPTAPGSRVAGPSVPSRSVPLFAPRTLGAAVCPCLSAQILSVKTQLSAPYFKTPSPIQQILILPLRHSFKHHLKLFRGQKLCQALGHRDQSNLLLRAFLSSDQSPLLPPPQPLPEKRKSPVSSCYVEYRTERRCCSGQVIQVLLTGDSHSLTWAHRE